MFLGPSVCSILGQLHVRTLCLGVRTSRMSTRRCRRRFSRLWSLLATSSLASTSAAQIKSDTVIDCFRYLENIAWKPVDVSPEVAAAEEVAASKRVGILRERCCSDMSNTDVRDSSVCFNPTYTREICCAEKGENPPSQDVHPSHAAPLDELIRQFLSFSSTEWGVLHEGLRPLFSLGSPKPVREISVPLRPLRGRDGKFSRWLNGSFLLRQDLRLECEHFGECLLFLFVRLFRRLMDAALLPLRDPWEVLSVDYDRRDYLHGAVLPMLVTHHRSWNAEGHELVLERLMVARFALAVRSDVTRAFPSGCLCLDWQDRVYGKLFDVLCSAGIDEIRYEGDGTQMRSEAIRGGQSFIVDIHKADRLVPAERYGFVVCFFVFEHLHNPWLAFEQLFRLVAPGGFVAWAAPHFSQVHSTRTTGDYWRFTPQGATMLATKAGFKVRRTWAPGHRELIAGYYFGMQAPYWSDEEIFREEPSPSWPLLVHLLLQRPTSSGEHGQ